MSIRTVLKTVALTLASATAGAGVAAAYFNLTDARTIGLPDAIALASAGCILVALLFVLPLVRKTHLLDATTKELYRLSRTDYLTGLPNRRDFYERAAIWFEPHSDQVSVLVIDIDHFKALNDTFGHAVGDQVLTKVSAAISQKLTLVSGEAVIGRIGGEEFAVLVPRCPALRATEIADSLCMAVEAEQFATCEGLHRITVSIGIDAETTAGTLDASLLNADSAAYASKEAGRNRWTMWTPGDPNVPVRRQAA